MNSKGQRRRKIKTFSIFNAILLSYKASSLVSVCFFQLSMNCGFVQLELEMCFLISLPLLYYHALRPDNLEAALSMITPKSPIMEKQPPKQYESTIQ